MKTKLILLLFAVALLIAGWTGIHAQQEPSVEIDMDALKTEIVATLYPQIFATVQAEFMQQMTPIAPGTDVGTGLVKPTQPIYAHMARLIKQDKNYLRYKLYEDWDVTFTFKNVGSQDWTEEFYLRYYKGAHAIEGDVIFLKPAVKRGESISVTLHFDGVTEPGIYNSYWELINNDGHVILDNIWVGIEAK